MKYTPVDIVVTLLVLAVVYSIIMNGVMGLKGLKSLDSNEEDKLLAQVLMAIIGLAGAYIGSKLK
jgi:hypothetical protein